MSPDGSERYSVYQCYDCHLGITNRNPDRVTCDNCGSRDWVLVVE
jgi:DNA-directed RNA polymerase subunit RPC12/RpoP